MRNHYQIVTLLLVILILALAGCASLVSDIQQDGKPNLSKPNNKKTMQQATPPQPQYFFINGSLLGSYDGDGWNSLCAVDDQGDGEAATFYAKDLLDQDSYYVYEHNKRIGVSKQIIWQTEEAFGLGSFEDEDASGKFAKYGKIYHFEGDTNTAYRIFELPVKLDDELSEIKIPDYSFTTDFVFGDQWERFYSGDRLNTNSRAEMFPKPLTYGIEPTAEVRQSLLDLFNQNDMENMVRNFTDCILGDLDNDENEEYLMLANNPRSESGYPLLDGNGKTDQLGVFSVILYQDDDGSIQTLYHDLRPYYGVFKADEENNMELMVADYCTEIDLCTLADLNADGVYEIVVRKSEWEHGYYLAYALNEKGEYEAVMRSNSGM